MTNLLTSAGHQKTNKKPPSFLSLIYLFPWYFVFLLIHLLPSKAIYPVLCENHYIRESNKI